MSSMTEMSGRGHVSYDQSHVNIKIPNRCRRCNAYNENPDGPTLRESYVILLNEMTRSPQGICFLVCLSLPGVAVTTVALLLLLVAGHTSMVLLLLHCFVLLILARLCAVKYFGRRYGREYSAETDLLRLHAAALRQPGGLQSSDSTRGYENTTVQE